MKCCSHCGVQLDDDAVFCRMCGEQIVNVATIKEKENKEVTEKTIQLDMSEVFKKTDKELDHGSLIEQIRKFSGITAIVGIVFSVFLGLCVMSLGGLWILLGLTAIPLGTLLTWIGKLLISAVCDILEEKL